MRRMIYFIIFMFNVIIFFFISCTFKPEIELTHVPRFVQYDEISSDELICNYIAFPFRGNRSDYMSFDAFKIRIDIHFDGLLTQYHSATYHHDSDFIITNKWTDSERNIWYTIILERHADEGYCLFYTLVKISDNGRTLEILLSAHDYPKEIDPNTILNWYEIYYRQ